MVEAPITLSPSGIEHFLSCPLAFRFTSLERLPERPTIHTTRGSLVHRALHLAFARPAPQRTPDAFRAALARARAEFELDLVALDLDDEQRAALDVACADLVERAQVLEDPTAVRAIGLELRLSAQAGALSLRGVIDRLDLTDDGELVVVDYKTGRPPGESWEQRSLAGVRFYAFLCEQVFGRRPVAVRLVYLSTGEVIEARPSEQSTRFVPARATAIWQAIELAAHTDDFRPRPGFRCATCSFQSWCPAFGGDPDRAAVELLTPELVATAAS